MIEGKERKLEETSLLTSQLGRSSLLYCLQDTNPCPAKFGSTCILYRKQRFQINQRSQLIGVNTVLN